MHPSINRQLFDLHLHTLLRHTAQHSTRHATLPARPTPAALPTLRTDLARYNPTLSRTLSRLSDYELNQLDAAFHARRQRIDVLRSQHAAYSRERSAADVIIGIAPSEREKRSMSVAARERQNERNKMRRLEKQLNALQEEARQMRAQRATK